MKGLGEGRSNQTLANPKSQWWMEEAGGVNSFLSSGSPKDGLPEVWSRRLATRFRLLPLLSALRRSAGSGGGDAPPSTPHFVPVATFFCGPPRILLSRVARVRGQGVRSEVSTMGLLEKSVREGWALWMGLFPEKKVPPPFYGFLIAGWIN